MFELCLFDPKLKKFAPGKFCQRILLPVKQVMTQCRALTELVSTQMSQLGCRPRVKPLPRGTSAALRPWTPGSRISQRDTKDSLGNRSFQKLSKLHMVSQQKSAKILENLGFLIWFALKRSDGMESICVSFLGVILGGPFVTYFSRATSHLSCDFKLNGFATDWDLRR